MGPLVGKTEANCATPSSQVPLAKNLLLTKAVFFFKDTMSPPLKTSYGNKSEPGNSKRSPSWKRKKSGQPAVSWLGGTRLKLPPNNHQIHRQSELRGREISNLWNWSYLESRRPVEVWKNKTRTFFLANHQRCHSLTWNQITQNTNLFFLITGTFFYHYQMFLQKLMGHFFWPQNHRISTAKNLVALPQPSKGLKAKDGGIEAKDRWGRRNTQRGLKGEENMAWWIDGWMVCLWHFFFCVWPFNPFFWRLFWKDILR